VGRDLPTVDCIPFGTSILYGCSYASGVNRFRILIFTLVLIGTLVPIHSIFAQDKKFKDFILFHPHRFYRKFMPGMKVKRNPPDSTYIKTYPNYLSVGMHVLSPAISVNWQPRQTAPGNYNASSKFRTNVSDIAGFSASYRFVSFGFAFLLKSGMNMHADYAPSRYRTATIKFSGSANTFQFKYIRIQGFTDIAQPDHLDPAPRLRQRRDMVNKEFQFEILHNFHWKKYSYIAPLTFAQRQIKSHAGFLLKAGVYYDQLSGDSTLINAHQKPYYDALDEARVLRSLSIRLAPGVGANLIFFKSIYVSLVGFASCDLYLYKYLKNTNESGVMGKQTFGWVLDGKASVGYHAKRLYAGVRFETERRAATLYNMESQKTYTYTGIELGYRFDAPGFVQKFYKKTMPPGM